MRSSLVPKELLCFPILMLQYFSYIQSFRNVGVALRRYAEAEVLVESSLSVSDRTPSQASYPSPSSPLNVAEVEAEASDSPLHHNESPFSTSVSSLSYMRSSGCGSVTVTIDAFSNRCLEDESNVVSPMPLSYFRLHHHITYLRRDFLQQNNTGHSPH